MESQQLIHHQISRFLDNFKKLGRSKFTPALVRSRVTSLKELWLRFNDEHAMLERTTPTPSKATVAYFAENIYDKTEEMYNTTLDYFAELLAELEPPLSAHRSVDYSIIRPSPTAFTAAHLPVIQLSPFDGTVSEWEPFRDRFTAVIIDNKDLSDFARMHYLISYLRGRALENISGLAVSADNFDVAWQMLRDRYDNKRRLLSVHMSTLLNLPRLSRESATEMQALRSKIQLTLASLANLQRSSADLWNDFLIHIVLQHLDATTRRAWTLRAHENSEPHKYESLDRFLVERIRALEDMGRETSRPLPHRTPVFRAFTGQLPRRHFPPFARYTVHEIILVFVQNF